MTYRLSTYRPSTARIRRAERERAELAAVIDRVRALLPEDPADDATHLGIRPSLLRAALDGPADETTDKH
ncbi:hypothetical protein CP973_07025 [Streptomyces albofaciens JCM 4342]|uniref:hypothetical protein n=1 Tax=Streptomyces albofaciens TaxID=66866 RepID=UPI000A58584D|nr:hypothetical protein [Streptomyces albofaciens]KAA6221749.1 hypothetical protein CP973_07025 [Streptomyces albofaciens JCM 4342]